MPSGASTLVGALELRLTRFRIMLTCHQVLTTLGDPRRQDFLTMAHKSMKARAELLEGVDRDAFLSNVPTNRAIGEAWQSMQQATN